MIIPQKRKTIDKLQYLMYNYITKYNVYTIYKKYHNPHFKNDILNSHIGGILHEEEYFKNFSHCSNWSNLPFLFRV